MAFTNETKTDVLNNKFRDSGKTYYVGLATNASLTDASVFTDISEVTDTSYARQQITFNTPTLQPDGKMQISNALEITFPAWTANQSPAITYAFITDALTGATGALLDISPASVTINAGQPAKINIGAYKISLD